MRMLPRFPGASTMTPRSPHGTSGLFDKGFADKAGFLSATLDTPEILKTIDASELFPAQVGLANDLLDGTGLESDTFSGNDVPLVDLVVPLLAESNDVDGSKDFRAEGSSTDFLEGYMDLSCYLTEGGHIVPETVPEVSSADVKMEVDQCSFKRSLDMAFPKEEAIPVNTDHDAYTAKVKCARYSSSEVDEQEPECSGTKTTTRYIERRRKNNIASRRSRETRKQKFMLMEQQAGELEFANTKLERQVTELENLTKLMKNILVQRLSKGK